MATTLSKPNRFKIGVGGHLHCVSKSSHL